MNTPEIAVASAVASPIVSVPIAPVVICEPLATEVARSRGPRTPSPVSSGAVERERRAKAAVSPSPSTPKLAVPRAYRTRSGSQSEQSNSTAPARRPAPSSKASSGGSKSQAHSGRPVKKESRDGRKVPPPSRTSPPHHKPRLDRPASRGHSPPRQPPQRSSLPPRPTRPSSPHPHPPSFLPRTPYVGSSFQQATARLIRDRSIRVLQTRARGVFRPPFARGAFPGGFNRDRDQSVGGPAYSRFSRDPSGPPQVRSFFSSSSQESRPRLWTTRGGRPFVDRGRFLHFQSPQYTRGGYTRGGYTRGGGYIRGAGGYTRGGNGYGDRSPPNRSPLPFRKRSRSVSRSHSRSPYQRSRDTRDYQRDSRSRSSSRSRDRSNFGSASGSRSRRDSSDHQSRAQAPGSGPRTPPHSPPAMSPERSRVEPIRSHSSSRAMTPSKRSVSSGGSRSFQTAQAPAKDSYEGSYEREAADEQPSPPPGNPPTPPLPPPMRGIEHSTLILAGAQTIDASSLQSQSLSAAQSNRPPAMSLAQFQNLQIQMQALAGAGAPAGGQLPLYNLYTIGLTPTTGGSARTVLFKPNPVLPGAAGVSHVGI